MKTKHSKCPKCGTRMKETGAPIWEEYCPNNKCKNLWDRIISTPDNCSERAGKGSNKKEAGTATTDEPLRENSTHLEPPKAPTEPHTSRRWVEGSGGAAKNRLTPPPNEKAPTEPTNEEIDKWMNNNGWNKAGITIPKIARHFYRLGKQAAEKQQPIDNGNCAIHKSCVLVPHCPMCEAIAYKKETDGIIVVSKCPCCGEDGSKIAEQRGREQGREEACKEIRRGLLNNALFDGDIPPSIDNIIMAALRGKEGE